MPARPNVPGVALFTLRGTLDEDTDVINRFFVQFTGGPLTNTQAVSWATSTAANWVTFIQPVVAVKYTLTQISVEDLTSPTAGFGVWDGSHTGTRAGTPVTAGACLVIKQHINRRYRGGHPRVYLYSLTEADQQDANSWNPADSAAVVSAWGLFQGAIATGAPAGITAIGQVNVSYFQGFTNHTFPSGRVRPIPNLRATPVIDLITSYSPNNQIASQRRRYKQGV